ncbi:MAG: FHA domain-containing protein [Planctomycetota bacterium]
MAKLVIQTGKLAGKQLAVPSKEVLIGRDEGCYIRMGSPDISRKHCSLRATPAGIQVTDLGSSNGTWVNDAKIVGATILKAGDLLRVGPALFRVDGPKPLPIPDYDIASWLADGDSKTGMVSDEDTAIHKAAAVAPEPQQSHPPAPIRTKRVFKTIAEEAQYIIAIYQEQKALEADQAQGH